MLGPDSHAVALEDGHPLARMCSRGLESRHPLLGEDVRRPCGENRHGCAFKWADMRPAHMMPPQHPPLFGVPSLTAPMLVLDVDLAFQAGDLWTVVEAPLSVAVFPVAIDLSHLGDHSWLRLTSRDVSSSFQFAVLSDLVKDWIE